MILYLTVNKVDSCHGCVRGPLTRDTRDILWMNDSDVGQNRRSKIYQREV